MARWLPEDAPRLLVRGGSVAQVKLHCPQCDERMIRDRADGSTVFHVRVMFAKRSKLFGVCHSCSAEVDIGAHMKQILAITGQSLDKTQALTVA